MKLQINKIAKNPVYLNFIGKHFRYVLAKYHDNSSSYYTDSHTRTCYIPSYAVTPKVCIKMLKLSGVEYEINYK